MNIERAKELRRVISGAMQSVDDEIAVNNPLLFPEWEDDKEYPVGFKLQYGGALYKVLQTHNSQSDWTPENAPSLFAKVLAGQEGTEIGEWTQPDSTNPYMTGDKVIYNGKVYESVIDNNVWSPDTYPAGWKEVTD